MAYTQAPSDWITDWSEDGSDITVPIASFPELTEAEADGTTGDIREVVYAFLEAIRVKYLATATADRPTKMTVNRSTFVDESTGVVTRTYSVAFTLEESEGAMAVVDEPS
jgi:hypothetical protein